MLDADDQTALEQVHAQVAPDWRNNVRLGELEHSETELTDAEQQEYSELESSPARIDWEPTLERLERCVANWCLAHPEFVDLNGQPTQAKRLRRALGDPDWPYARLEHLFSGPPTPAKCPRCNGRGFIQPDEPRKFPVRCGCA